MTRSVAALASLCFAGTTLVGQVAGARNRSLPRDQSLPRTLEGKPDLSGIWAGPMLPTGLNFKGKELPFRPGGEAIFFRQETGDIAKDDPTALCLPDGMPREALSPYPTQILQPAGYVVIIYEYEHFVRVIPTDGREHKQDLDLTWMGDPVGKWDGDTLVVDTIGFKEWALDAAHKPQHWHTDALHLVERFRRTDARTIGYELTVDDPKIFSKPWAMSWNMTLHPEWEIFEQVCEENNVDAQHLKTGSGK